MLHAAACLLLALACPGLALAQASPQQGRAIVANRQLGLCLLCHSAPIPEERFQGNLAPNLQDLVQGKSHAHLRQILQDPSVLRPDTLMPAYGRTDHLQRVAKSQEGKPLLTPQQIDDVIAYLMSLQKP